MTHLSAGTDEGGVEQVYAAPGVLGLPHQVSGGVVGAASVSCPDLFTHGGGPPRWTSLSPNVNVKTLANSEAYMNRLPGFKGEFGGKLRRVLEPVSPFEMI